MKTQIALKLISLLILFTIGGHSYANGPSNGGGGYKYRDTAYKHVQTAQLRLERSIQALNQIEIDAITRSFSEEKFEKQKFIQQIANIEFADLDDGIRNVNGQTRARDFDYNLENGGHIIALKPFLESGGRKTQPAYALDYTKAVLM